MEENMSTEFNYLSEDEDYICEDFEVVGMDEYELIESDLYQFSAVGATETKDEVEKNAQKETNLDNGLEISDDNPEKSSIDLEDSLNNLENSLKSKFKNNLKESEIEESDYQLLDDDDFKIEQLETYKPLAVDEVSFAETTEFKAKSDKIEEVLAEINRETVSEALITDEDEIDVAYSELDSTEEKIEFSEIEISKQEAKGSIQTKDLRDMCTQFSKISSSGISSVDTVRILIEQTENRILKDALQSIKEQMKNGNDLSEAMINCGCFPFSLTVAVSAAEKNDMVPLVFERFGEIYKLEDEHKLMQRRLVFYPALITACSIIVMIVMMLVVYPRFVDIFKGLGGDLPKLSKDLLLIANGLKKSWWILLIIFVLIFAGILIYKWIVKHNVLGKKIGIKSVPEGSYGRFDLYARFARYMNAMLEVGVTEKDALFVTARTFVEYPFMTDNLLAAANASAEGSTLSNALCVFEFFPLLILQMISVGEEMGDTPKMLMHIAEYYEDEAEKMAKKTADRREPIAIAVMVAVVLVLLLVMLQPVLEFYELVKSM